MTDPNVPPDVRTRVEAVLALMIEECHRLGYVQRDKDATDAHRQRLATLLREMRGGEIPPPSDFR